jgi:hypothetical protein
VGGHHHLEAGGAARHQRKHAGEEAARAYPADKEVAVRGHEFFENQRKMGARRSASELRTDARLMGAGPNLPVLESIPDNLEPGGQVIVVPDEGNPQIAAMIGDEIHTAEMFPEGYVAPEPAAFGAWVNLTIGSKFSVVRQPRISKMPNGLCVVEGVVRTDATGSIIAGDKIVDLPVGYRPETEQFWMFGQFDPPDITTVNLAKFDPATGRVNVHSAFDNGAGIALDGLTFRAA